MCEVLTVKHLLHTPVNMGPKVTIFSNQRATLSPLGIHFFEKIFDI